MMRKLLVPAVVGFALLAGVAACSSSGSTTSTTPSATATGAVSWSYSGATGPANWANLSTAYASCGGQLQSPIDIVGERKTSDPDPVLDYTAMRGEVLDTGHAMEMKPKPDDNAMVLRGKSYRLDQMHAHSPSENLLAGRQFPAEFHFVHKSADGAVAVFSVFAEAGPVNTAWQPFIEAVSKAKGRDEAAAVDIPIEWSALPPKPASVIQFPGSLTTPPCTEGVDWAVNQQTITLSQGQIDTLRAAYADNNRPVQPTNGRPITKDAN